MKVPKPPLPRPPLFMLIFVSMFGFIGLAVLIMLWSKSTDNFGAPPLIFRLVGSGIAIAFMAFGFGLPITALRHRAHAAPGEPDASHPASDSATTNPAQATNYQCPNCGAVLGQDPEVSPSGDVKCSYCRKWWNIHQVR